MEKHFIIVIKSILETRTNADVIFSLIAFLLSVLSFSTLASLPKNSEGWTIFTPSEDSLIVYVSQNGNDETAKTYTKKELGNLPFTPPETILR
ncbi:hypothetical protein OAA14_01635 [bacterium]|nr:hypothetical protein [bacterium]